MNKVSSVPMVELFSVTPDGETIASMVEHKGKVIVATSKHVYVMDEDIE